MTVKKLRIIEFIIIGLVVNTLDNLIAVKFGVGARITAEVLGRIFLLVLPFAIISELIVDHPNFWKRVMKFLKIEIKEAEKKVAKKLVK